MGFLSKAGHNNTHRWHPLLNKRLDVPCRLRVGAFMALLCMTLRRRNDTGRSCFSAFCSRRTRDLAPIIAGYKVVQCRRIEQPKFSGSLHIIDNSTLTAFE